jgi:hypothetical protein
MKTDNPIMIEEDWKVLFKTNRKISDLLATRVPQNLHSYWGLIIQIFQKFDSVSCKIEGNQFVFERYLPKEMVSLGIEKESLTIKPNEVLMLILFDGITYLTKITEKEEDSAIDFIYTKLIQQ